MEKYKQLLSKAKIPLLSEEKLLEKKRQNGEFFNIFNVLGVSTDEVRLHSSFLAELLNVKGDHGLRTAFLQLFVEQIGFQDFKCDENTLVKKEYWIGRKTEMSGGYIDILLESSNGKAIIIENKIYAGDQENQLFRYYEYAKNRYKTDNFKLIYLTLDGHEPDKTSVGELQLEKDYVLISYKEHIMQWLDKCLYKSVRHPLIRETINQYIDVIKQLTTMENNTVQEQELIALISEKENIKIADKIGLLLNRAKDRIIRDFFIPQLKERISGNLKLEFTEESFDTQYACFNLKPEAWDGAYICFQFQKKGFKDMIYGIYGENLNSNVKSFLSQLNHYKSSDCWVCYESMKSNDWSAVTFEQIYTGDLVKEFMDCIETMLDLYQKANSNVNR